MINLSLSNSYTLTNQPDLIQHDNTFNQYHLIELKQKIQFLLNKIDIDSNTNELTLLLEQEQKQRTRSESDHMNNYCSTLLNRTESTPIQQELQTVLSVQSDLTLFNDRRSLRSIRSTDSFQSCPDVMQKIKKIICLSTYSSLGCRMVRCK